MHLKYNKIYALGKDETENYLNHKISVWEKIDGANSSVWLEDGVMKFGSRNQEVTTFNGFPEYCKKHEGINNYLKAHPTHRLFGEWLVRHTLAYNPLNYNHFYLFDIMDETGYYRDPELVSKIAEDYKIRSPKFFGAGIFTLPEIMEFVGKTELGAKGEGVVIKNAKYTNKFGIRPQYAKIVTQEFKEDNGITFGGNNKHSETYWEMYFVNKYVTVPRVMKVIQKLESLTNVKCELKDIPRIVGTVTHDIYEEEIGEMRKHKGASINFGKQDMLFSKKIIQVYKDILAEDISITDKMKAESL